MVSESDILDDLQWPLKVISATGNLSTANHVKMAERIEDTLDIGLPCSMAYTNTVPQC